MDEVLTVTEMETRFDSEWILVGDPETNELLDVERGKILYHSRDRDEVYRFAVKLRPKHSAMLYTGTIPEDTAIVI